MRRFLPASLTGRLVTTVVALTALVAVLVGTAVTLVMRSYLDDRLDERLQQSVGRARMDLLRHEPQFGGSSQRRPPPGQSVGLLSVLTDGSQTLATYIDTEGDLLDVPTSVARRLGDVHADGRTHDLDLPKYGSYRAMAVRDDGLTTVVALPTADVDDTVASLLWWELLLGLGATAAAGLAGRALVRRELRPLRDVADAAREVTALPLSSGDVDVVVRVPERLTDPDTEVGRVGESLNQLLDHVEASLDARHASEQQLRQFLADASHELRTPLATIKGYAELGRRGDDLDATAAALRKVESEAARMSTLVEDMLLLARLDAGRPLESAPVDLTLLLMEALDDARVVDTDRTWRLVLPDEPVATRGDEQRLHQAVTNLLANASRHTPPGTVVTASLRVDGDEAVVAVHDDGPGVPASLQATIFERFSRGDSSRTRASGGAGLGMSLVRAIVSAHGGRVRVDSVPGDTAFTLALPLHR